MKLLELLTDRQMTLSDLKCKLLTSQKILNDSGRVQYIGEGHFRFISEDALYEFKVIDTQDAKLLESMLRQYPYNLAQITSFSKKDSTAFSIHIVFFYSSQRETSLNVVVSQDVKQFILEKGFAQDSRFEEDVKDNFILSDGHNTCYVYTTGLNAPDKQKEDQSDTERQREDEQREDGQSEKERPGGKDNIKGAAAPSDEIKLKKIKLYGKAFSLLISVKGNEPDLFLYAEKIFTANNNIPPLALRIGELSFKDEQTHISEKIKKELEMTAGYLDIWDEYTAVEGDFILNKARSIGVIKIDRQNITRDQGGFLIYPLNMSSEKRALISSGDQIIVSEKLPDYLADTKMTWEEYRSVLSASRTIDAEKPSLIRFKIKSIDKDGSLIIEDLGLETLPDGVISYGIDGDVKRIIRREDARKLIENGESAMPSLGLVIEGKKSDAMIPLKQAKPIEPISSHVKEKIFAYEPRPRQRDAISIALNTPDIAIIQGPPGTGKTTVITAIIERLNELSDKRKDNRGQVLVTSFQHDAVRNIISRLSVNSLPTIKFGKQGDNDMTQDQMIEKWSSDLTRRLKERNPSIRQTLAEQEFERMHNSYLNAPSDDNALAFLECAKKLNYDNSLNDEIESIIDNIKTVERSLGSDLVKKIRKLRCTKSGFSDDGSETADDLLEELEELLDTKAESNKRIISVLQAAAEADAAADEELLASLKEVKDELLSKCISRPAYKIELPRPEIIEIYKKTAASLKRPANEEDEILFDLLNELENNSADVKNMIAAYNLVYAATAQQSEGIEIKKAKGLKESEHPIYDTVIIDEAARVNPGDLMIPMSQASRRIILVGDHRQLPHIYDEEIFENMRDNGNDVGKDVVKISMFQYLKEKAEKLSKSDGIPRTITLDAQYRMHPELGNFINDNFYARYGEGFESPLSADKFAQSIYDKPYMWVFLGDKCGREEKIGTSRIRECEADYIADKIQEYMLSEKGKALSYGVITFYSAQVELIKKKLKNRNISDNVRVGSVDAFQGMEFDVIFLSVVRSHFKEPDLDKSGMDGSESDESRIEDIGMRYYGFLTSENRLCVALSRQKRLLIVVGNADIFHKGAWGGLADKCVPALKNFFELCKSKGAVVDAET